jgi:hypothetical protein
VDGIDIIVNIIAMVMAVAKVSGWGVNEEAHVVGGFEVLLVELSL